MNSKKAVEHDFTENEIHRVSVLLVDDDPAFLQVAMELLQTHHQDQLNIVGTARSSEDCIAQAHALAPEVVLMDLNMPGIGGLWAIPLLRILLPETRVIALTLNDGENSRNAVFAAGGNDLVSKSVWKTELVPAIHRALKTDHMAASLAAD